MPPGSSPYCQPAPGLTRLPKRLLGSLLSLHGSEGSSNVVLCTNTAEVDCQGRHLTRAQHTCMSGRTTV